MVTHRLRVDCSATNSVGCLRFKDKGVQPTLRTEMSNLLGLIPARGGSRGIPRKNIRNVCGKPLLAYSIEASLEASCIDRTVVSTDDEEIGQIARDYGADVPFRRPDELATDEAPTEPVVEHALQYFMDERDTSFETVAVLQPTSPLRTPDDLDDAFSKFEGSGADSLVSVFEDESYRWEQTNDGARRKNYTGGRIRRQEKEPEYVENGAIYMAKSEPFLETGDLQVGRTELFVMDRLSSVDVDEPAELELVEHILRARECDDD